MELLIRNTQQLGEVVTFSGDIEYASVKPALRSAQQFVARYTGLELLTELAEEELSDDQTELLGYVQVPIGNLAMLNYANANNVRLTDLGVMRTHDANTGDAFEWQLDRIVSSLTQQAFDGLEQLLGYLVRNLDTFPAYQNSAAYKKQRSQLIQSADVFSEYYEINSSRLILQTLQASMRTAEMLLIRPLLGDRLTELLGEDLSDAQALVLDAARRALAYATIARALREKLVRITPNGVQVLGISAFGTTRLEQPASDKQLERSIAYFDEQASNFIGTLATALKPAPTPTEGPIGSQVLGDRIVFL